MLMGDGLRRNAYKFPVKIAAQDRFRQITYGDLNSRVNQLAMACSPWECRKATLWRLSVGNRIEHLEILFRDREDRRPGDPPRYKMESAGTWLDRILFQTIRSSFSAGMC